MVLMNQVIFGDGYPLYDVQLTRTSSPIEYFVFSIVTIGFDFGSSVKRRKNRKKKDIKNRLESSITSSERRKYRAPGYATYVYNYTQDTRSSFSLSLCIHFHRGF